MRSQVDCRAARWAIPKRFQPVCPTFDVLVVAGDIWEGDMARGLGMVAKLAAGKPVVFVVGNSDYWNGTYCRTTAVSRDH
jgi:predicted MPP superfamily phosphohydrolase